MSRALALAALLALCGALAACGGGDDCRDDFAGPPAPGTAALPLCPDDGRAGITPPNCITHPERCS